MFIPISTERPRKRPTVVTYWLLGLCAAVYLAQEIGRGLQVEWLQGLFNAMVLDPNPWGFAWWQPVTYLFLHAGPSHLIFNMVALYVFGPAVEDRLRRLPFLAFYLFGGAMAGGVHALFDRRPIPPEFAEQFAAIGADAAASPVIGASGAIAAVTGAFLVLFPLVRVRVLVLLLVIGVFGIPAWWFIALSIAGDLFFGAFSGGRGVAHAAHLGGYAFGAATAATLLWTKVLPRETYDLFSIGKQAHRRRRFRELSTKQSAWIHEIPPARRRRPDAEDGPPPDDARRAEIVAAAAAGRLDEACDRYERLLDDRADATLPLETQLGVANHALGLGRRQLAAAAYELFLKRHPADRRAHEVRLMLAVVNARYLNDPVRAKALLQELASASLPERDAALRDELLAELG